MSTIKTNRLQTLNGDTYNLPVQVVRSVLGGTAGTTSNDQTNDNPAWAISTTSTTWTDTTNLQLTITPKFVNSIIKLELSIYLHNGGANRAAGIRIIRGTTIVWRPGSNSTGPYGLNFNSAGEQYLQPFITCYDSPAVVTPVTYSLQYRSYNGTGASNFFGQVGSGQYAPPNTFTAIEIAQ